MTPHASIGLLVSLSIPKLAPRLRLDLTSFGIGTRDHSAVVVGFACRRGLRFRNPLADIRRESELASGSPRRKRQVSAG